MRFATNLRKMELTSLRKGNESNNKFECNLKVVLSQNYLFLADCLQDNSMTVLSLGANSAHQSEKR